MPLKPLALIASLVIPACLMSQGLSPQEPQARINSTPCTSAIRAMIKGALPKYDPRIHQKQVTDHGTNLSNADTLPLDLKSSTSRLDITDHRESQAAMKPEEEKRDAKPIYTDSARQVSSTDPKSGDKPVMLPAVIVRVKPLAPSNLPRVPVKAPENDIKLDPFLSGKGRDAQLVKKHLPAYDRWTIPILGQSKESRARKAEADEQAAVGLGEVADAVDMLGQTDPKSPEYKKLKELYNDLMYEQSKVRLQPPIR